MLGGFSYKEPKKWLYDHKLLHSGDGLPVPNPDRDQLMVVGFSTDGTKLFGQAQEDEPVSRQGAVYEANLIDGVWTEVSKITASANVGESEDWLGEKGIYCHENKLFVSAISDDDSGSQSGALFVFHSSSAGWQQVQKIVSASPEASEAFGSDPMMTDDGRVLICSAYLGETEGSSGTNSGVIHIFNSSSAGWQQVQEIWGPIANSQTAMGRINSDGTKIVATSGFANAVYVYQSGSSGFQLAQTIQCDDVATGGKVGHSLKISPDGNTIIAGSYTSDAGNGALYVFESGSSGYTQSQKIVPTSSKNTTGANFGRYIEYSEKVTGASTLKTIAASAELMDKGPMFVFKYDDNQAQFIQYQEIELSNPNDDLGVRGIYVDPQHEWLAAASSFYSAPGLVQIGKISLFKWSDEY